MYHKILVAAIGITFLLASCRTKNTNPLTDFEKVQEHHLEGTHIKLASDTILFKPFDFLIYDSLAFFNDNTGEAGYSIINLKTGKLVRKFAFSGSDSTAFDVNALYMNNALHNPSLFSISQANSPFKIFLYHQDSVLTAADYKPLPVYYPQKFGFSTAIFINDTMLFGRFAYSKFDNNLFGIVNIRSNKLITGLNIPGADARNANAQDSAYFKWMKLLMDEKIRYRPGSNYEFVWASTRGAMLQIFDIEKDYSFKKKYEKVYYYPVFNLIESPTYSKPEPTPECRNGFTSIAVTKDKIYALYNGPSLDDKNDNEWNTDIMLVFDWNGEPVEKIKLDRKVNRIVTDASEPTTLYALYGDMSNEIVRYKLP